MRENRGPEARLRQHIDTLLDAIDRVPPLLSGLERLISDWSREGVVMHAESLAVQATHRARLLPLLAIPFWLAAISLILIAWKLLSEP
jgi:hypothetical protein